MFYFLPVLGIGLGIVIEAWQLIYWRSDRKTLGAIGFCAIGSLVAFVPFKSEVGYNLTLHFLVCFIVFAIFFIIHFRNEILPVVNERVILIWHLIFLYVYFRKFENFNYICIFAVVIGIINLLNVLLKINWGTAIRFLFYVWFLIMIVFISVAQFTISDLALISKPEFVEQHFFYYFLLGMVCMYIFAHLWHLVRLIPIPEDGQTWRQRFKIWKSDTIFLASKYINIHTDYTSLFIILALTALLVINYFFNIINDKYFINLAIIFIPFLANYGKQKIFET